MTFINKFTVTVFFFLALFFFNNFIFAESKINAKFANNVIQIPNYPDQGSAINTLRTSLFFVKNDATIWAKLSPLYHTFYQKRNNGSIQIFPNKSELKFNYWLQDKPANLVVIIPGTGEHYVSLTSTAMAELFYKNGYSAVIISSAFNWEFMQAASSVKAPGFAPTDAKDTKHAIDLILKKLQKEYPNKILNKVLLGVSMGAMHTLFIADMNKKIGNEVFQRYIAINTPVDLLYSMHQIDDYYKMGATWDKKVIQKKVKHCIISYMQMLKEMNPRMAPIAGHIDRENQLRMTLPKHPQKTVNITQNEAKFLIGLSFHIQLTEVIYSIFYKYNFNVIKLPKSTASGKLYSEINKFNFNTYLNSYLLPVYKNKFGENFTAQKLGNKCNLSNIADTLKNNHKIRIIHNADDFLINSKQLSFLQGLLGTRIKVFAKGGHLGNLYTPQVQKTILELAK